MAIRILGLSAEERIAEVAALMRTMPERDARAVVWWAMLTPLERAEFMAILTKAIGG
jgi:hypothetical protein